MTFLQNKIIIGLLSSILLGVGILIFRTPTPQTVDNEQQMWKTLHEQDVEVSKALNELDKKRKW
jgi:hypothetical protein